MRSTKPRSTATAALVIAVLLLGTVAAVAQTAATPRA